MKTILFTIVILILANCSNPQPKLLKELVNEQNKRYEDDKNQFFMPKEIFAHFPDKIKESYPAKLMISLDDQHNAYQYFILMSFYNNEKFFKKNEEIAKKTAQKKIMPTDTTQYFIVPTVPYYTIENLFKNKVPIPNFKFAECLVEGSGDSAVDSLVIERFFSETLPCGLTTDYEIYVIDNQNEYKTFSEKYKTIFTALPKTANTGFSRGICINRKENIIIFWTIIF